MLRELLEPHAKVLVKKAVDLALEGDTTALRLCLERLIPPKKAKDDPVRIDGLSGTLTEQATKVIQSMAEGDITPAETAAVIQAIAGHARITEIDELERRIVKLEHRNVT